MGVFQDSRSAIENKTFKSARFIFPGGKFFLKHKAPLLLAVKKGSIVTRGVKELFASKNCVRLLFTALEYNFLNRTGATAKKLATFGKGKKREKLRKSGRRLKVLAEA